MTPKAFWLRLDVWLITATIAYWILYFSSFTYVFNFGVIFCDNNCGSIHTSTMGTWWADLIGLFVSVGPNNIIFAWLPGLIALGIFIIIETIFQVKRITLPIWSKVFFNIILLMLATLLVDLITVRTWASMGIFLSSIGIDSPFWILHHY
jgi:hypothetical protein